MQIIRAILEWLRRGPPDEVMFTKRWRPQDGLGSGHEKHRTEAERMRGRQ